MNQSTNAVGVSPAPSDPQIVVGDDDIDRERAPEAATELLHMMSGGWVAQAISVAARLRIADLLVDGPLTVDELAAATETHGPSLFRLLRALAGAGVFAVTPDGRFELTALANALRSDAPASVRAMCALRGERWYLDAWAELLQSVRTGTPGFEHARGVSLFEFLEQNPDTMALFAEAMSSLSTTETAAILAGYDFAAAGSVVDVGGGQGVLLTAILQAHPHVHGVLFDLPGTVERAAGGDDSYDVVGGSFFDAVPEGGDVYLLKSVLHDWDDDDAVAILGNCRRAMAPDARLVAIERVIPPGNEPSVAKWMDLNMLVGPGGRERSEAEYRSLYRRAGFELTRTIPTASPVSLIEGTPVPHPPARHG